ncbi:Membrane-spanning 4-domains subfamily A member 3 [Manis javanica]|nr:Membrane-spanning 4-domains subfamily A member 3 [Manis javanica]
MDSKEVLVAFGVIEILSGAVILVLGVFLGSLQGVFDFFGYFSFFTFYTGYPIWGPILSMFITDTFKEDRPRTDTVSLSEKRLLFPEDTHGHYWFSQSQQGGLRGKKSSRPEACKALMESNFDVWEESSPFVALKIYY